MTALEVPVSRIATLELTRAERRVIEALLVDGAGNETLARRCGIKRDTAKSHVTRVLKRADLPNRTALVIEIMSGRMRMRTVAWSTRRDGR